MRHTPLRKYLCNCFLLTLPVMAWNIFLTPKLPAAFQPAIFSDKIPALITYGETIARLLVFLLAALMPLHILTHRQRMGLYVYTVGVVVYGLSWIPLLYFPASTWSTSLLGFMAPAYTPLGWLVGMALVGRSFYFQVPYRPGYFIFVSVVFLIFHNLHTFLVYVRIH
ncbi:hypothetical protein GCM10027275_41430 [Rhabdobacter roseus]|uniref:Uncharacterized protein n=1 Tax=Rhabdobacter roseus TaxID=1655419 RepID=A0A840U2P8_9BACT|nr:hypothetical protein [Rhabdobacter roseus]MBB5286119.1 hypothetical protein [Rhabdobacter roseus]